MFVDCSLENRIPKHNVFLATFLDVLYNSLPKYEIISIKNQSIPVISPELVQNVSRDINSFILHTEYQFGSCKVKLSIIKTVYSAQYTNMQNVIDTQIQKLRKKLSHMSWKWTKCKIKCEQQKYCLYNFAMNNYDSCTIIFCKLFITAYDIRWAWFWIIANVFLLSPEPKINLKKCYKKGNEHLFLHIVMLFW